MTSAPVAPSRAAPAETREIDLGGGVKLELVLIPAGRFMMGSPVTEKERSDNETQHEVTISKPFYMGKYPVTQAQWSRFVQVRSYRSEAETSGGAYFWTGSEWKLDPKRNWNNPGFDQGPGHPVVCVSWNDAQAFINWLNSLGQSNQTGFCLPTEAQWEHACRARTTTPFHFGCELNGTQANCNGNYPYGTDVKGPYLGMTSPVGSYSANRWGLHDMHGNVWEWCSDWYGDYGDNRVTDPQGAQSGEYRVLRGGSWNYSSLHCRSASRIWISPGNRGNYYGFRVLLPLESYSARRVLGWQVQGLRGNDEWENIIFDKKRPVTFPTREAADEALGELLRRFFEKAKKERMNADPIEMRVAEVTD